MQLRVATRNDAAELARLRWDFSTAEQMRQPYPAFVQDYSNWLDEALSGHWTIFVAESDGRLVGNVYVNRVGKVPRPGHIYRSWGYVTSVYMEPEVRNGGVGSRLLAYVESWARNESLELLLLWPSDRSVPFYERAGFIPSPSALELSLEE